MEITIEVDDELLRRAKRHAHRIGSTLSAVIEDGLRHVLDNATNVLHEDSTRCST